MMQLQKKNTILGYINKIQRYYYSSQFCIGWTSSRLLHPILDIILGRTLTNELAAKIIRGFKEKNI